MHPSHDLPLGGLGDDRQPRDLPQEARRGPVDERQEQEQENSAVEALEEVQPDALTRVERSLEEVGEDEEDIEDDGLHRVEADVTTKPGRVADDGEIEGEEE